MYPIETQDKLFHDGDGVTELGTVVTALFLNTIQAELINVVAAAGIPLDKQNQKQVADAIMTMIESSKSGAATNTHAGITKILNTLNSDDSLSALSAAMGKELAIRNQKLADEKADKTQIALLGMPAGAIQYFAMRKAPDGWLEANGVAVSRTQYANLFNAIGTLYGPGNGSTTFNLPELRGQFIRCWDNGRGVDPNRGIGSWQDSDNKWHQHSGKTGDSGNHQHSGTTNWSGNHTHPVSRTGGGGGTAAAKADAGTGGELAWAGNHNHTFDTTWNGEHSHGFQTDPSGSESRPINIALLACIKI